MNSINMNIDELLAKCYANDHDEKIRVLIRHIQTHEGTEPPRSYATLSWTFTPYPTFWKHRQNSSKVEGRCTLDTIVKL